MTSSSRSPLILLIGLFPMGMGLLLTLAGFMLPVWPGVLLFLVGVISLLGGIPLTVACVRDWRNEPYRPAMTARVYANTIELARLIADRPDAAPVSRLLAICDDTTLDDERRRLAVSMLAGALSDMKSIRPLYDVYAAFAHLMEEHPRDWEPLDATYRQAMSETWEGASPYGRAWPVTLEHGTLIVELESHA